MENKKIMEKTTQVISGFDRHGRMLLVESKNTEIEMKGLKMLVRAEEENVVSRKAGSDNTSCGPINIGCG